MNYSITYILWVSKFQCCKVAKERSFNKFKMLKFQRFNDFILQKAISCFWKILIPYSRFSRCAKTIFKNVRRVSVATFSKCTIFKVLKFPKNRKSWEIIENHGHHNYGICWPSYGKIILK